MKAVAERIVEWAGLGLEMTGVAAIVIGSLLAIWRAIRRVRSDRSDAFSVLRQHLGRAILLGLEFLVAADIIRTVATLPTMSSVVILGLIVFIRTFLSFTLEVELEGAWPWNRSKS